MKSNVVSLSGAGRWLLLLFATAVIHCSPSVSDRVDGEPAASSVAGGTPSASGIATPPPKRCARRSPGQPLHATGVAISSGPLALARWGEREVVLIADEDERALAVVDAVSLAPLSVVELPAPPSQLLVLKDGRVAVTLRYHNRVALLEPAATPAQGMQPLCVEAPVREPLALAEHGEALYVLGGAGAELVRLHSDTMVATARVSLGREPRGLLLSPDGASAWVSHMSGSFVSKVDFKGESKAKGEPSARQVAIQRGEVDPEVLSRNSQGFALARYQDDGGRARLLLPHSNSDAPRSGRSFGYGGGRTQHAMFALWTAVIDEDSGAFLNGGREKQRHWRRLCSLPRAALVHGERLWVACLDEGSVVEMDARFVDPTAAVRRVYQLADGPAGLAMNDAGQLYVWSSLRSYFDPCGGCAHGRPCPRDAEGAGGRAGAPSGQRLE